MNDDPTENVKRYIADIIVGVCSGFLTVTVVEHLFPERAESIIMAIIVLCIMIALHQK